MKWRAKKNGYSASNSVSSIVSIISRQAGCRMKFKADVRDGKWEGRQGQGQALKQIKESVGSRMKIRDLSRLLHVKQERKNLKFSA